MVLTSDRCGSGVRVPGILQLSVKNTCLLNRYLFAPLAPLRFEVLVFRTPYCFSVIRSPSSVLCSSVLGRTNTQGLSRYGVKPGRPYMHIASALKFRNPHSTFRISGCRPPTSDFRPPTSDLRPPFSVPALDGTTQIIYACNAKPVPHQHYASFAHLNLIALSTRSYPIASHLHLMSLVIMRSSKSF